MRTPRGLLIDLDGTVYEGAALVPGASSAIGTLRRAGIPFLFTTNTSRRSRADIVRALRAMGLETRIDEILTAPRAAAQWLRDEGIRRVYPLVPDSTLQDLAGFEFTDDAPEAVLVGDLGRAFDFDRLNRAFLCLRTGARLVAIHRNRFWIAEDGLALDAGPFVAALEYAAGVEAVLVGKPAAAFFEMAARLLGLPAGEIAVVGDDAGSDVLGGRRAGFVTVQVRTGKGEMTAAEDTGPDLRPDLRPDRTLASLAEVPAFVGLQGGT